MEAVEGSEINQHGEQNVETGESKKPPQEEIELKINKDVLNWFRGTGKRLSDAHEQRVARVRGVASETAGARSPAIEAVEITPRSHNSALPR